MDKITKDVFLTWVKEFSAVAENEWPERTLEALNFARKFGEVQYNAQILWGFVRARDRFYKTVLNASPEAVRKEYYRAKRRGGSAYKEAHNALLDFAVQQGIIDNEIAKIFKK